MRNTLKILPKVKCVDRLKLRKMIFLTVPFSVLFFTKTLPDLFNFCLDKGEKGDYNLPVKK